MFELFENKAKVEILNSPADDKMAASMYGGLEDHTNPRKTKSRSSDKSLLLIVPLGFECETSFAVTVAGKWCRQRYGITLLFASGAKKTPPILAPAASHVPRTVGSSGTSSAIRVGRFAISSAA